MNRGLGVTAVGLLLALAGCAGDPARPQAPAQVPRAAVALPAPAQGRTALAFPVADAVSEAQLAAVTAGFDAALKARLSALPLSSAYRMVVGGGQAARLILDADRAFEVGNAQLKPELLLPLADTVEASRAGGAWVIHVVGVAGTADEADLAERRSASVLAYLASQGVAGGRLRAETRRGSNHRLELQFVPIVEGREARAWMAPESLAAGR